MNISNNISKPLHIFKASAGSGKTFTLAVEYIKLLIKASDNYKHILAVTFTNKATEEMKMRILAQLYGISKGLQSSQPYVEKIAKETGVSTDLIRVKSAEALKLLLHDYDFFRIETIDSFFQRIFRNLAHELDLTPNLRIDLNDGRVLEEAVDCIVKESASNTHTRKLLLKFIEESIADDHGWNIIDHIKNFGKNIFRDFYKDNKESINKVISNINHVEENLKQIVNDFENKMNEYVDIYYSTNPAPNRNIDGYFKKLKEKRYTSKDNLRNKTVEIHPEIFEVSEKYRMDNLADYLTAKIALKNFPQLALLQEIGSKVNELNANADRFLLSDTQNILSAMITSDTGATNENAPFIYEKIGARLRHIMIDEFQDTSVKQWQNFQVLLNDCIAQANNTSLIVGDIKQSIYRWRSGDWRLLHGLEKQYDGMSEVVTLDTNYRSSHTVVQFNNDIFEEIIQLASNNVGDHKDLLISAYKDIKQNTKPNAEDGYVGINFLDDEDYLNKTMQSIYDSIVRLKAKGYKENDIAILVRGNDGIAKIADYFAENYSDITIISDEAFKLDASKGVSIIIEAMKYLVQNDDISYANLVKLYQNCVVKNSLDETELLLNKASKSEFLPKAFAEEIKILKEMPPYELAERLFCIFNLSTMSDESGYFCSFFDVVLNYVKSSPTSIKRFISDWDTDLHKQTIQSDSFNGIRIMTIHKSKGLEFTNVIIPFCDWKMEKPGSTIWVSTENIPMFCGFPIVPVAFSQTLTESHFASAYNDEHFQNIVDNINLLYVAFTRARKNLFIISKSHSHSDMVSIYLEQAISQSSLLHDNVYQRGTLKSPETEAQYTKEENNPFNQQVTDTINVNINSSDHAIQFNQSYESNIFASNDDIPYDLNRERGILLHDIFSSITTVDDTERVLDRFENQGLFCKGILTKEEAKSQIEACFANETLRDWFSDKWHSCNERDIVSKQSVRRRCDRIIFDKNNTIVLDFKFGKPESKYKKQVKEYISLLSQVGFKNVRGFLWYAEDNTLEEVE